MEEIWYVDVGNCMILYMFITYKRIGGIVSTVGKSSHEMGMHNNY